MTIEWDKYYHRVCETVASNSKCLSRQIGAILVQDKSIISTGYCGPPRGVPHCGERYYIDSELRKALIEKNIDPDDVSNHTTCPRYVLGFKSGEGLEWCVSGHAERNVLINAARESIKTKDAKLYMSCGIPCKDCLTEIINAGIEEIIIIKKTFYDIPSKYLLGNSNLKCRVFGHLREYEDGRKY